MISLVCRLPPQGSGQGSLQKNASHFRPDGLRGKLDIMHGHHSLFVHPSLESLLVRWLKGSPACAALCSASSCMVSSSDSSCPEVKLRPSFLACTCTWRRMLSALGSHQKGPKSAHCTHMIRRHRLAACSLPSKHKPSLLLPEGVRHLSRLTILITSWAACISLCVLSLPCCSFDVNQEEIKQSLTQRCPQDAPAIGDSPLCVRPAEQPGLSQ